MKKAVPIVLIFFIAGCGNSLKHSWNNFTAYYNTFYNARKNYKTGLTKVNKKPIQVYPDSLILPHAIPPKAGVSDFELAEQDAIQLLHRFPTSKWADDALLLLGKTYYHQYEFYNAKQKFEEVLDLQSYNALKQKAAIWNARILLNTHSYEGAIKFLYQELTALKNYLNSAQKAEIQLLIAENQAKLGNWADASALLETSLPNIQSHLLTVRGYYLLGQVLKREGRFEQAYHAFNRVHKKHPRERLLYWSGIKKIETARLAGLMERAISICSKMSTNRSYNRRLSEIYYQQALNYKAKKDYNQSAIYLKKALKKSSTETSPKLYTQIYFELGIIYSRYLNNYKLAVAYFDSSSNSNPGRRATNDQLITKKYSPYQRYAVLKKHIQRDDSLLMLSSLSARELRKKLTHIRNKRREITSGGGNNSQKLSILNTPSNDNSPSNLTISYSSKYGFLNYRNLQLVKEEQQKFVAHWGNRPLVDDWRRAEAVSGITEDNEYMQRDNHLSSTQTRLNNNTNKSIASLLKDIPGTNEARKKLHNKKLYDQYALANLFFLNLGKPDSAAYYYHHILAGNPPKPLKSKTYYSLFKLFQLNNHPDSSRVYKNKILRLFPQSHYAAILKGAPTNRNDSTDVFLAKVRQMASKDSSVIDFETAFKLQKLALEYHYSEAAPAVYFKSIKQYIRFTQAFDSTQVDPASLQSMKGIGIFYQGKNWDKIRMMLTQFVKEFPNATRYGQAKGWLTILQKSTKLGIPTCKELSIQPEIIGGKKEFIESVKMPKRVRKMNISGMVRFRLMIKRNGKIISIQLLSRPTHLGIEAAYVKAIRNYLRFEPFKIPARWPKISCDVSFPIK